jgi:hypothetical protein
VRRSVSAYRELYSKAPQVMEKIEDRSGIWMNTIPRVLLLDKPDASGLWHHSLKGPIIRTSKHPRSADKLFAAIDNRMHFSDDEADSDDENGSFIVLCRRPQMDEDTVSD